MPGTTLWQIFVHDPSGVMLELTFDGKVEQRPTPEMRRSGSMCRTSRSAPRRDGGVGLRVRFLRFLTTRRDAPSPLGGQGNRM